MRGATRQRAPISAVLLAAAAASPASAVAQPGERLEIRQTALANVFSEGADPSFDVETSGDAAAWSVSDHSGLEVATGRALAATGTARITVPVTTTGHYRLRVSSAGSSARTTFAVLPRAERRQDGRFTFGVQTHFGQGWDPPTLAPLLASIGAESVRDAQRWEDIETGPGAYDFSVQDGRYQEYMDRLAELGIEPLINFGRGNRFHDDGCTPYTGDGRRALGRFVRAVLRHYGDRIRQVGAYNEPNLPKFGDHDPGGNGDDDPRLCNANARADRHRAIAGEVFRAVNAERRDVTVSAPELSAGTRGLDEWLPWLERYLSRGGAQRLDAVSLHPYRPGHTPEGLAREQIAPVRELMDANDAGRKPIWITELGWRSEAVGERDQAAYVARAYVLAMQAGVERLSWYNLADHGKGTFGLLHAADAGHAPKPALVAYAVMTAQLGALSYAAADSTPAGIHSHRFAGGDEPLRVMWAVNEEQVVHLRTDEPVEVTDTMGNAVTIAPDAGRVTLTLSGDPIYVRGDVAAITREG